MLWGCFFIDNTKGSFIDFTLSREIYANINILGYTHMCTVMEMMHVCIKNHKSACDKSYLLRVNRLLDMKFILFNKSDRFY